MIWCRCWNTAEQLAHAGFAGTQTQVMQAHRACQRSRPHLKGLQHSSALLLQGNKVGMAQPVGLHQRGLLHRREAQGLLHTSVLSRAQLVPSDNSKPCLHAVRLAVAG